MTSNFPSFPKLKITNSSLAARTARIWLDDVEITDWCNRITLDLSLKNATELTLHVLVSEVDVEADGAIVDLHLSQVEGTA